MRCSAVAGFAEKTHQLQFADRATVKKPGAEQEILIVLSTWPDLEVARSAARTLIEEHRAACANVVPGIDSIYRWKDQIEQSVEVLMLLKVTVGCYPALAARIRELHPY